MRILFNFILFQVKMFGTQANLMVHVKAHTQEKTFQCEHCNGTFCDSSTLKKHLRIHTGEKPFKCSICEKTFSQSGNLKRHFVVHQKYDDKRIVKEATIDSPQVEQSPLQVQHNRPFEQRLFGSSNDQQPQQYSAPEFTYLNQLHSQQHQEFNYLQPSTQILL